MEGLPEQFGPEKESTETEPNFEYIFYRNHDEVFRALAKTREEAFEKFEQRFNKTFNPEEGDGFTRMKSDIN